MSGLSRAACSISHFMLQGIFYQGDCRARCVCMCLYNTIQYNTIQYNTIQHNSIKQKGRGVIQEKGGRSLSNPCDASRTEGVGGKPRSRTPADLRQIIATNRREGVFGRKRYFPRHGDVVSEWLFCARECFLRNHFIIPDTSWGRWL